MAAKRNATIENTAANSSRNNSAAVKRTVLEATAPLGHLPYDQQLKLKEANLLAILRSYGDQAQRINHALKTPNASAASANVVAATPTGANTDNVPCRWLGIRPSPQPDGYRNKSEFTVGRNAVGEKVVGFRLSSYVQGSVEVDAVADLPHIPERMKRAALVFQSYVNQSALDVFSPELYRGCWRQLTVRMSQATGALMLVIGVHSAPLAADELTELKADLADYFGRREGEGRQLAAASVYVEHMNKREPGQMGNTVELVCGQTHITDTIHGLVFRISPESFFQVNTPAAEVLYRAAIELGRPTADTTVMDICCGTGTIGLCFAKHCRKVVGVEIVPQAIEDAAYNARENRVENCAFFAGNCDDYIRKFVHDNVDGGDLLAIIDPPRAGLRESTIVYVH